MKKVSYFLLTLLATIVSTVGSQAAVVDNYTYDFNAAYSVTNSSNQYTDHKAAPEGWVHLPDSVDLSGWGTYSRPDYSFEPYAGRDDSGCLYVTSQSRSNDYYGTVELHDYLITPALTGNASLWAKLYSSSGSLKIYKATYSEGKYTIGDEITPDTTLSKDEWKQVTISGLNNEMIAIRASYLFIDDFAADKAEITYHPTLSLTGESNMGKYHDVDDDGNYTLSWKVVVSNTGKVDIAADEYQLALIQGSDTLKTINIPAIAAGEKSDSIAVEYTVNIKDYPESSYRFRISENCSGTVYSPSSIALTPAKGVLSVKHGYSDVENGTTINFGTCKTSPKYTIKLENKGGRNLELSQSDFPEGFSIVLQSNVIAPHSTDTLELAMDNALEGYHGGDVTLGTADTTFTLHLYGAIVPNDAWYEPFEENAVPSTFVAGGWEGSYYPQSADLLDNKYSLVSGSGMLVTPKLAFDGSDKLMFDATIGKSYDKENTPASDLKVYYSTDRKSWKLVSEISTTAADEAHQFSTAPAGRYGYYYQAKPFSENIPEGEWYIGFKGTDVYLDNIAGGTEQTANHDLFMSAQKLPTTSHVNSTAKFTVDVQNLGVEEPADSYTAQLFIDGKAVATADAVAIAAGKTVSYAFNYTPHAVGTYPAYVALSGDSVNVASDTVQFVVAEETAESEVRIGTPATSGWSTTTRLPVIGNYAKSQSELIYRASDLSFGKDTKIKAIAFHGTNSLQSTFKITAKIGNSTVDDFSYPYAFTDSTGWSTIYDGNYTFEKTDETAEVMRFDLATPFVYDGTNLHLFFDNVRTDKGTSLYIEKNDDKTPAIYRSKYSDGEYSSDDEPYTGDAPVVYLTIERAPKVLSGNVTSKTTGKAVAGADVTLTSGDVIYNGTTDANGHYSITVYKFDNTYDLAVNAADYMPYAETGVSVKDGNKTLNAVLADAKGLYVKKSNVPATATVNHKYTATATVENVESATIAADAYTATLFVDGDTVATATTKDIASGESVDFSFSYTPHAATTTRAYIVFDVKDDAVSATDTVSLVISPEDLGGTYQAGDSTSMGYSDLQPVNSYYQSGMSETIYPAEAFKNQIPEGANITGVSYRGYMPSYGGTTNRNVRVYIENTNDPVFTEDDGYGVPRGSSVADTTKMTKVFDGVVTLSEGMGSSDNPVTLLNFQFSGKVKYTGGNLRVFIVQTQTSDDSSTPQAKYVSDKNYSTATWGLYQDTELSKVEDKWYQRDMPVAWFEVENAVTLSGKVTDKKTGKPVDNATVTLKSGDVVYTGTTDAEGNYTVTVAQTTLSYTVSVAANGYTDAAFDVTFADGNEEKNIDLIDTGIKSISVSASANNGNVYTVNGVLVRHHGESLDGLKRGIYIVNGHKFVVK